MCMNTKLKLNIFTFAHFLYLFCYIFEYTFTYGFVFNVDIGLLKQLGLLIMFVLFLYDFINKKTSLKTFVYTLLTITLGFIITCTSKNFDILLLILIILSIRDINIDKFIFRDFIIRGTLVAIEFFFFSQKAPIEMWQAEKVTMGFTHANTAGSALMILTFELLYLTRNSKNILPFIFSIILTCFNYYVCKSRASCIAMALIIVCFILLKLKLNILKFKLLKFLANNSILFFIMISFGLIHLYKTGSDVGLKLDSLFSGRMFLADHYLNLYKINLFGNQLSYASTTVTIGDHMVYVLDTAFVWLLLTFGIIGVLFIAWLFYRTFKKLLADQNYYMVIIMLVLLVYGLMETILFKYYYNPLLAVLTIGFFADEKEDEKLFVPNNHLVLSLSVIFICIFFFRNIIISNSSQFYIDSVLASYNQPKILFAFYNRMHDFNFSLYDWSLGLGANIFDLINQGFLSPFNFLSLLLPSNLVISFSLYLNFIKLLVLSNSLLLWFNKIYKNNIHNLLFSLVLSFSSLVLGFFSTNSFDFYCLFPLVLFFLEKAIQDRKFLGLSLSIFLCVLANPSLSISLFIVLIIFLIYKNVINSFNPGQFVVLTILILLSMGLASFAIIPCLGFGNTNTISDSFISIFLSLFTPFNSLINTNYVLYTSITILAFLPCVFYSVTKELIARVSTIIICILLCLVLKEYFVLYFVILFTSSLILNSLDSIILKKNNILLINFIICLILCFVSYIYGKVNNTELSSLLTYTQLLLLVLLSLSLLIYRSILSFSIIMEACISIFCLINQYPLLLKTINYDISVTNSIKDEDKGFYRIIDANVANTIYKEDATDFNFKYNFIDNCKQVSGFSTKDISLNLNQEKFINLMTKTDGSTYKGSSKNYTSLFNIAGAKYWISNNETKGDSNPSYYVNMFDNSQSNIINFKTGIINVGDSPVSENGQYSGSLDSYLATLSINLQNTDIKGDVCYTSYYKYVGWEADDDISNWKKNGEISGIEDFSNFLGGIRVAFTGQLAENFDIYYRISDNIYGWHDWAKNGEKTGCYNYGEIDRIQIDARPKGSIEPWKQYYINKYFIELGYVNNNLINEDYLLTLSDFEKEKILRKYVATNTTENTYYDFDDHFINISDYFEEPDFTFELPEPISNNKTLVIINGGIPIVTVYLYYQGQYLRTENFYQYDYCNIDLREGELVDKIAVSFTDIDETGFGVVIATKDTEDYTLGALYNDRINNSFTNIDFKNDYISADININSDNSFVYTYIPYDDNWHVYDNGNEISKINCNFGFTGFNLDQGEHHIEFRYFINNSYSNIVSLCCLFGIIVVNSILFVYNKKNKH